MHGPVLKTYKILGMREITWSVKGTLNVLDFKKVEHIVSLTAVRFADPDFLLECKISAIWRRFPLILHFIFRMSAIFLLPVCLTYWPRKYTTRVDPHVDDSHQVWSPWVMSDNVSHWLPLKMRTRPLRMRRITWLVSRGSKTITFLESPTLICLFTIQLLLGYDDD